MTNQELGWKICVIPLGGYVKFFGDRNVYSQADNEKITKEYSKEDQDKLFVLKPLYQRALIVFGGPLANFLLAILIFFSSLYLYWKRLYASCNNRSSK